MSLKAHAHFFLANRRINKAQKSYIETLQNIGVRTTKVYAIMAIQNREYEYWLLGEGC
jgi:adenine-specific DNA methylase